MFRVQAQAEKLEEHLESPSSMWSEYEDDLKPGQGELKKEEFSSLPQIRRQIEDLKGKIKALGNINVNAIRRLQRSL